MTRHATTPMRILTRPSGFTLLEMMIVVAIIGVMATLGVANVGEWKKRADLKEAIVAVQNDLTVARMTAMARNIPVTATVTVAPTVVTVTTTNPNTGAVLLTSNYSITHVTGLFTDVAPAPPSVFAAAPNTTVSFNSMGFRVGGAAATLNQVFLISNDRLPQPLRYALRITPRGGVSWCPAELCQGTH